MTARHKAILREYNALMKECEHNEDTATKINTHLFNKYFPRTIELLKTEIAYYLSELERNKMQFEKLFEDLNEAIDHCNYPDEDFEEDLSYYLKSYKENATKIKHANFIIDNNIFSFIEHKERKLYIKNLILKAPNHLLDIILNHGNEIIRELQAIDSKFHVEPDETEIKRSRNILALAKEQTRNAYCGSENYNNIIM